MKVLLISNLFPSSFEPTRGVFNLNRFGALSRHCDVRLLCPTPWWSRVRRPREIFNTPSEDFTGIASAFPTYWSLPRMRTAHARGMYLSLAGPVRRLRAEFPFDAILAAWAYPDAVAAAHLARDWGCPLVTMVLGSDINETPKHPNLRRQIVWALGQSERIIAVSSALHDKVVELGIPTERVLVQRNGVDGQRFQVRDKMEARCDLGLALDRSLVVYVGNFKQEKGVAVLVDATAKLGRDDVDVALVGDGPQKQILLEQARDLGIESQVKFCGRRPHGEIPAWMAAADVVCLPSYREGCPNVVLEALAAGRPVVASRVGGVPELVSDATGVLIPPGDPDALSRGLDRALTRSWEPEGLRASVDCLSWSKFGRTLHYILEAAVEEQRRRSVKA